MMRIINMLKGLNRTPVIQFILLAILNILIIVVILLLRKKF